MSSQNVSDNINYQYEMARMMAELDPDFATSSNYIFPVNPIEGLDVYDVLGTVPDFDLTLLDDTQNKNDDIVQVGEGGSRHSKPLFTVKNSAEHFYKKFQMAGTCYTLEIPQPDPKMVPENWLRLLLNSVIDYFKNNSTIEVRSGDKIGLSLRNDIFLADPVYVSLRRADQLDADVVLEHILRIFDSNKEFFLNGHLVVNFDHIQLPHGKGRVTRKFGETNAEFILKKACYLKYKNPSKAYPEDDYCLPYALVLGRAFIQAGKGEIGPRVYQKYQRTFKTLRKEAEKLCRNAGVDISCLIGGCSIDEAKKFQAFLTSYQIVIYTQYSKNPIYVETSRNGDSKLNIMYHENHYTAMRSVAACFGAKYICTDCHTHTDTKSDHFCKYACTQCQGTPKCQAAEVQITCFECNRYFYGKDCYNKHLKKNNGSSVCIKKRNCPKCKTFMEIGHECGKRKCFTCEAVVEKDNHLCTIPIYNSRVNSETKILYVMFDLETQQDSLLTIPVPKKPNKFKHVANLCVAQAVCTDCIYGNIPSSCVFCGNDEEIYYSKSCIEDFMNFIVKKRDETKMKFDSVANKYKKCPKYDQIVILGHNLSGFDGQFILKYIYECDRFKYPSIIMSGTRVIEIRLAGGVKFIDSLNYFQVGLSKLPELCGFEGAKGHYPFLMNTDEMKDYIGPKPAKKFYGYDSMSTEARDDFDEWYDNLPVDYIFNNSKELIDYCIQDVTILRKACVKFITEFYTSNGIDAFAESSTIAGACNKVFRSKYMLRDSIGVIPTNGYRLADTQSKLAIMYLCSVELELGIEIQHAGRGREFKIPGVGRVDGIYQNTVWEMDGCFWHSCTCLNGYYNDGDIPVFGVFRRRRDSTLAKHNAIRAAGYNLIVKRECDFRKELQAQPGLETQLRNHPLLASAPINPRDAFFGGRTNANTLYFKPEGDTKVLYADICSLYPYIQKTSKIPIGVPKIHVGDACTKIPWQNIDGLMKVTVLPPRGLDFPVLPMRLHKKLLFVLCKTCAEDLNQDRCTHSETERQFTGTFVMDEVKLAVKKGYEIAKIHEIWEYEVSQYDPVTKEGGLFAPFINNFYKLKTEASGYPESRATPEQRKEYIEEFYEKEGILLDESKIEYSAPRRLCCKIMLNSFWGRFGMRDDLMRTKLIHSGEELCNLIFNTALDIHSVYPINDDHMLVNYREKEEARTPNKTTNVVIAAFITAYARMELYKYLDMLGTDRVLYYDTDAIIFIQNPGDVMPETGDFLGQLTDELAKFGKGSYIIEFVSGGPKNYAFRVFSPTKNKIFTVVKVKGITLNYENSQVLNFELIKSFITDPKKADSKVQVSNNCIRRTNVADVYTTRVPKTYRIIYNKRQKTGSNYGTIPFGY